MSRAKIVGLVVSVAALYGGWLLLRDAPVFAVQKVVISGLRGPGASTISQTLQDAARGMTTTHVQVAGLLAAVSSFAVVKDLRVQTEFPHGLRIQVIEELPVAALVVAGQRLPVAADGRILRGIGTAPDVATVATSEVPIGGRVSGQVSLASLELLGIAPPELRSRVGRVSLGPHGLTAELRSGPALYFGDAIQLHAKWAAVARVLADSASRGARYVDVHVPERPAAQVADPATSVVASSAPGTAGGALLGSSASAGG